MYENIIDTFQNNNSYLSKQLLEILWTCTREYDLYAKGLF